MENKSTKVLSEEIKEIEQKFSEDYKYGFVTDIDQETIPAGLNENIIKIISSKKRT